MNFTYLASILIQALTSTALSINQPSSRASKPAYFVLAGDSTTAKNGGWGTGFLTTTVLSPANGTNLAKGGASTASFRAGGYWSKVISSIESKKSSHTVYVTIQFGHNDQKATSGVSLAQYTTNLGKFVSEALSAGAVPILVTPLTRRSFTGSPPKVKEDLSEQRTATIKVAKAKNVKYIDLNAASVKYVNAIGPDAAHRYNLEADDNTHLNPWGSVVFARLVSDLLGAQYSDIAAWTVQNATLSAQLKKGQPA